MTTPPKTEEGIEPTLVSQRSEELTEPLTGGGAPAADRYTVELVLGRGGMGEVRLCLDRRIRRPVALKVPPAALNIAEIGADGRFVGLPPVMTYLDMS